MLLQQLYAIPWFLTMFCRKYIYVMIKLMDFVLLLQFILLLFKVSGKLEILFVPW